MDCSAQSLYIGGYNRNLYILLDLGIPKFSCGNLGKPKKFFGRTPENFQLLPYNKENSEYYPLPQKSYPIKTHNRHIYI